MSWIPRMQKCKTTYINSQLISVVGFDLTEELNIRVAQVGADSYPLSFTNEITITVDPAIYEKE